MVRRTVEHSRDPKGHPLSELEMGSYSRSTPALVRGCLPVQLLILQEGEMRHACESSGAV
jgi:hypothetical protein